LNQLTSLGDEARIALDTAAGRAAGLFSPNLRLGVTGLSRAGKTVFITALVHNLIHGGRLPLFDPVRSGRLARAYLEPQPDDSVPRFAYEDHVRALCRVLADGTVGETYNIGGHNEKTNIDVVHAICDILDAEQPVSDLSSYRDLITFVTDRPGHDHRYAIDASKIERDLGWTPNEDFASGLQKTVQWYLSNIGWCETVTADT